MNYTFKRIFSFIFIFVLLLPVSAVSAYAQAVTFEQTVNAATYVIVNNEGNYTTVVKNDVNAVSVGKLGWHATNALNLLKDIIAKNPTQALNILGISLYNEIVTSSSWEGRVATSAEANVLSVLLATVESREVQDETAFNYISGYVRHGQSLGITEPRALVFFADYENQNGRNGAYSFYRQVMNRYGYADIHTLYNTSSRNSRRTRTYNFCLNVNFSDYTEGFTPSRDTTAPEITNVTVSGLSSTGYTVSCNVADNRAVTEVYFAVYYKNAGADSAKWYHVTPTDGRVSHTVDVAEFSSRSGDYCTFIYAFDKAGNYAYAELNVITVPDAAPPVPPLTLTVSASGEFKKGGHIRWSASAANGSGSYLYTFVLNRDGKYYDDRKASDYGDFELTAKKTGVYTLYVEVKDRVTGNTTAVQSADLNIFEPIEVRGVKASSTAAILGQTLSWTVDAVGGEGELKYSYSVLRDGEVISSSPFSQRTNHSYRPESGGIYTLTVTVSDERNQTVVYKCEEGVTVIEPLYVGAAAFSDSYAVKGAVVSCSVSVKGGGREHSVVFDIFCDGEPVLTSNPTTSDIFTFEVPKGGTYTAKVTVTDDDGTSAFAQCVGLTADETAKRCDANCDGQVSAADARYALRCSAQLEAPSEKLRYAVDANNDGKITAADARLILRVSAKLETVA